MASNALTYMCVIVEIHVFKIQKAFVGHWDD